MPANAVCGCQQMCSCCQNACKDAKGKHVAVPRECLHLCSMDGCMQAAAHPGLYKSRLHCCILCVERYLSRLSQQHVFKANV
jgi:hypothetical protein